MALKSDEDLMLYITNAERYTPEAVNAAIAELQKRGKHFEAEEIAALNDRVQIRQQELALQESQGSFGIGHPGIVTEDETAPLLYSSRAILTFSVFFSLLAGAILLAINIKDKKAKRVLIVSVIAYFIAINIILSFIPHKNNYGTGLIVNGIGSMLMMHFFWSKYIGKDTEYRARPIWVPLIICILICIPLYCFALSLQHP